MKRAQTQLLVALIAVTSAACTTTNSDYGAAYCDETGCFQCTGGGQCAPLTNPRCGTTQECGAGLSCTNIGCARTCVNDEACATGSECVSGYCAPAGIPKVSPYAPCRTDGECAEDQFCGDALHCVVKCSADEHCGPNAYCMPCGKCQPKGTPASCGGRPNYCSAELECGAGKECAAGRCHFSCDTDDACPVGQICGAQTLCIDDPAPSSPECALDLHCENGLCVNGYCRSQCESSDQCGGIGASCLMGVCQVDYAPAPQ